MHTICRPLRHKAVKQSSCCKKSSCLIFFILFCDCSKSYQCNTRTLCKSTSHIPANITHRTSPTSHIPNISHPKYPTSRTSNIPTSHIPNIPHPKHPTSQTSYIPKIPHLNIPRPEHPTSRTSHIPYIPHPQYPTSRTFYIPNIRQPRHPTSPTYYISNMTHNSNFIITFNKFPNTCERAFKHSLKSTGGQISKSNTRSFIV